MSLWWSLTSLGDGGWRLHQAGKWEDVPTGVEFGDGPQRVGYAATSFFAA